MGIDTCSSVHLEMPRITLPEAPGRLTTCKGHIQHGTHTDPPLAPSSPAQQSCCPHGKSWEENPAAAFWKIKAIFPRSVELKLLAAALSTVWEPRSALLCQGIPLPPRAKAGERHPHTGASSWFVCRAQPGQTDTCLGTLPEILCCSWEKSMPSPMELMIFSIWK